MAARKETWSTRLYRSLLRILPSDFRGDYGPEMEAVFQEQLAWAKRGQDRAGLLRLWWETITGIFHVAPKEHLAMLNQDVRFSLRMMRRNAGFSIAAVMILAMGIGVNTAIFSVIDAVLLRPLPYQQGHELVMLHQRSTKNGRPMGFSAKEISDYRTQNHTLAEIVEYHSMLFTLYDGAEAQRVQTGVVSAGFFEMFGVRPILGRTFYPEEDRPDAPAVLILSFEFWKTHQNGDPNIIGKQFHMNDKVHTVIGVLPPVPQYPDENDVYMATYACPFRSSPRTIANRSARMMNVFARLRPGVSVDSARQDLAGIAGGLAAKYPDFYPKSVDFTAEANSLGKELTDRARPMLLVLMAAAGFVLLIACANVANLTLSRLMRRERELAVRSALGAGAGRLLRQLVTESLILGVCAAGLGSLFAVGSMKLFIEFTARLSPRAREIQIDGSMLLFALSAGLVASVLAGSISAPYFRADLSPSLRETSPELVSGRGRKKIRNILIVCQVGFSFVLLMGAGLMLKSFAKLQHVDPGFVPQRVLAIGLYPNWSMYQSGEQYVDLWERVLAKVQAQPDVVSAAISSSYPLRQGGPWLRNISIEGRKQKPAEAPPVSSIRNASAAYFRTLGIPLISGREFTEGDGPLSKPVAVVNQMLARHYWPTEEAIGKRFSFDGGETWITVAGVVGDVREFGLNQEPTDEIYLSVLQTPAGAGMVLVRTTKNPKEIASRLTTVVREVDPRLPVSAETLESARDETLASPRVMTDLLAAFAALALVVAIAGVGGIAALSVSQRVHEIGVRVAMGASPRSILRLVVGQGMKLVAVGLVLGGIAAFLFTRLLDSLLYQVSPNDPLTFTGVAVLFAVSAFIACYVPARRAMRIHPSEALRQE